MDDKKRCGISRREFACEVAALTAAAALAPTTIAAQTEKAATPPKPLPQKEGLSTAAKAEAESNYQALLQRYGNRLNSEEKKDVHRLLIQQQKSIESLRGFSLENGDEPSLVLHLELPEVR
jgi:hypothetical protein